jgi:hypothetical protein
MINQQEMIRKDQTEFFKAKNSKSEKKSMIVEIKTQRMDQTVD